MAATTTPGTIGIERSTRQRPWTIALLLLLIAVIAAVVWALEERQRADELASEVAALTYGSDADGWLRADLSAFEAAYESGDFDQVRALYADDGILTTAGNTYDLYYGFGSHAGTWDVDGAEFRRLASLHAGEDFEVIGTPVAVGGNTVAFAWRWSSGIDGAALLQLRDSEIVVAVLAPSQAPIFPIP